MTKAPDAFRTISEVAELLGVQAHVLRFWESRFPQIRPVKRAGGRRYYRPADVALLSGIRFLLHDQGLAIRGVQKMLREQGVRHICSLAEPELLPAGTVWEAGSEEGERIQRPIKVIRWTPPEEPEPAELWAEPQAWEEPVPIGFDNLETTQHLAVRQALVAAAGGLMAPVPIVGAESQPEDVDDLADISSDLSDVAVTKLETTTFAAESSARFGTDSELDGVSVAVAPVREGEAAIKIFRLTSRLMALKPSDVDQDSLAGLAIALIDLREQMATSMGNLKNL